MLGTACKRAKLISTMPRWLTTLHLAFEAEQYYDQVVEGGLELCSGFWKNRKEYVY